MEDLLRNKNFVLAQEPTDAKGFFTRLTVGIASCGKSWGKLANQDDGNRDQFDSEMNALSTVVVRLQGVLNIEWILDEIDFINSKGGKDQSWRELEASYIQLLNALYLQHDHLHTSILENYTALFNLIKRLTREVGTWMHLEGYPKDMEDLLEMKKSKSINKRRLRWAVLPIIYSFFSGVLHKSPMGNNTDLDKFVHGLKVWVCPLTQEPIKELY